MGELTLFLPLLIIMGAFMFFASRRQKKAMQKTIDLHNSLQIGDRVHTTSGLQATITGVDDDNVDLEIAPGVVTTWMKLAVRDKINDDIEDNDAVRYGEKTLHAEHGIPVALNVGDLLIGIACAN